MEKTKKRKPQPECMDRLSELPDSLIFHILWFVPMKDVVRTMILSKRWRNRWTTTPFLNFDMQDDDDLNKTQNFVNRSLLLWSGVRILKFKVHTYYSTDDSNSIYGDAVLWVNFAKDKGVEELYLHLRECEESMSIQTSLFMVPQCLYSCSSLQVLLFDHCDFWINGNVQWSQLKSLTVTECFRVTEHVINQILSGSPRLEVLNLSFIDFDGSENLNIRSDSLKELLICKTVYQRNAVDVVSELTICSPSLETLEIKSFPYSNCRLINVSSLTHATIRLYGLIYGEGDDCDNFGGIILENGLFSFQDCVGDNFRQILQTIQHVGSVRLSFCCHKVLRAMKMRCTHSSFPNVKSLKIGYHDESFEQLVGLLDIFPQLERLVLQSKLGFHLKDDPEAVEYEAKFPESFLPQLRTIEVTWIYGDKIFTLVETLLKYACKLEQLVFRVKEILPPNSMLSASIKLLNMPRSSANCKISFLLK